MEQTYDLASKSLIVAKWYIRDTIPKANYDDDDDDNNNNNNNNNIKTIV
jgi:hypothetical protein